MNASMQISSRPPAHAAVLLLSAVKLPTEDLTPAHFESFFYVGPDDSPTGLVGLELFGEVGLLRSLVVAPERRGRGEGEALLRHAEGQARARGTRLLYLLTTTAEEFFARRGYARAARDSAPVAIRQSREFAGICPASSTLMCRQL